MLRGPQGTLFGRNSSIGSINFITNTPINSFEGSASVEYGNYDTLRAEAMLNLPVFDGLIARFAFRHEEQDGDVKNTDTSPGFVYPEPWGTVKPVDTFDSMNSESYLAKLRWEGTEGLVIDYKYDREEVSAAPNSQQLIGYNPTSPLLGLISGVLYPLQAPGAVVQSFDRLSAVSADHSGLGKIKNQGHMVTIDLDLTEDINLRSITAYRETQSTGKTDLDGGSWYLPFPIPLAPGVSLPVGPVCISCSVNDMDQHHWSEELQLLGNIGDVDFVLGGYYFDEHARFQNTYSVFAFQQYAPAVDEPTTTAVVFPLGTPGDQVLGNDGIYDNRSIAVYGHVDYAFNDFVDISLGARYTWDDRSTNDLRPEPLGSGLTKYSDSRFTYDAAVNFHPSEDVMLFVKYATGYTSGGIDSNVVFKPEVSDQVELGFKGEFANGLFRLNGSFYHTWVKDRQTSLPNTSSGANCSPVLIAAGFTPGDCPVGLFVYNLPGTTKIAGYELESVIAPVDGLTLTANMSYNDPKFSTGELHRAPKKNISLSAQYDFPEFSNGMYLTVRADGNYRSDYYATGGNVDAVFNGFVPENLRGGLSNDEYTAALKKATISGNYWLVNARVALANIPIASGQAELAGYVRNLTDTRDPYFTVNYGATFHGGYERPRQYGVRLSYKC